MENKKNIITDKNKQNESIRDTTKLLIRLLRRRANVKLLALKNWYNNKFMWYHWVCVFLCLFFISKIDFNYGLKINNTDNMAQTLDTIKTDKNSSNIVVNSEKPKESNKKDTTRKDKKNNKTKKEKAEDNTGENSEFAPADPEKLNELSVTEYIKKYKYLAIQEMRKTKIPASITLAQAILESRSGNSRLAKQLNNHFGIKCHSRTCCKGHCMNYTDDSHKDFFINFKSVEESYRAHSVVVLKDRYTSRLKGRKDYKSWAYALQDGGYATGKKYASKIIRVIETYKLYQYDK